MPDERSWTFLTNHAHVLFAVYCDQDMRQRQIADLVGITEGAVQRILSELEQDGYVERVKVGRCNTYRVVPDQPLRPQLDTCQTVGWLLQSLESQRAASGFGAGSPMGTSSPLGGSAPLGGATPMGTEPPPPAFQG